MDDRRAPEAAREAAGLGQQGKDCRRLGRAGGPGHGQGRLAALFRRVSGYTHQRRHHHEAHLLGALRAWGRRGGNLKPAARRFVSERLEPHTVRAVHSNTTGLLPLGRSPALTVELSG